MPTVTLVALVWEPGITKSQVEVTSASLNQQVQNPPMGSDFISCKIK